MKSQDTPSDPEAGGQKAQEAVMRDWMTIWHSEAAAMGVDREMQESCTRMAEAWASTTTQAGAAELLARMMPGWAGGDPAGGAGADAAPWPAAAADASDASGELASLRREIAELRSRVERLEAASPRKRSRKSAT